LLLTDINSSLSRLLYGTGSTVENPEAKKIDRQVDGEPESIGTGPEEEMVCGLDQLLTDLDRAFKFLIEQRTEWCYPPETVLG
jgi:hypothetical protein